MRRTNYQSIQSIPATKTTATTVPVVGIAYAVIIVMFSILFAPVSHAEKKSDIEIKSETLNIDADKKEASFSGHVSAHLGALRFHCDSLHLTYTEGGKIRSLTAMGNITVEHKGVRATASVAKMNIAKGIIVLTGSPKVTRDQNTLTGKSIEINIHTGHIEISEAIGTFHLSQGQLK